MATFLISGATGGIGRAICERLSASHRLVLTARDQGKLDALKEILGPGHLAIPADMSNEHTVSVLGNTLRAEGVTLDGMVLMPPQPHADNNPTPDPEVWRELFQSSFIGPLSLLKTAIDHMRPEPNAGKRAKVVIISGISSAQVLSHYATANVIRTAWLGQAKTLAFAYGPRGVHINTLSLGGTLSPWYRDKINDRAASAGVTYDEQLRSETENVPLQKYGEPSEVAGVVEALLSPMSDHMTGLNILHDGGFTRAY